MIADKFNLISKKLRNKNFIISFYFYQLLRENAYQYILVERRKI